MDDRLNDARAVINEVNQEIAALFERRMRAVEEVARYKSERGLPVLDAARESEILATAARSVKDPVLRSYYNRVLESMMDVSKAYQHRLMEGLRVAYCGVEGAFAQIACKRLFPSARAVAFPSFEDAYAAVLDCRCDCAVLPIENSRAGEVGQVTDLMYAGGLFVNSVGSLPIRQNLLAIPETDLTRIRAVVSHPQALGQCREYIRAHGFAELPEANTAVAARLVAERRDPAVAAIASAETAALYGLQILDHDIHADAENTTRFAVFSRVPQEPSKAIRGFMLIFTVNHAAGALSEAISVIAKYGFNMKSMRSRPDKSAAWQYYFYAEIEGSDASEGGQAMLKELREHCNTLKLVGRYCEEAALDDRPKGGTNA